jgi:hypothetical protein
MPDQAFSQEEKEHSTINIGLLLPDTSHWWSMTNLKGFIDQANRSGGYQNKNFRLVVRTTDGPWGTGSTKIMFVPSWACRMAGAHT